MNNLAPMKNCPGGVQGNLNWMPGYYLVALFREIFERYTMHHSKEQVFTFIMMLIFSRCTVSFNNYSTLYMAHSIPLACFHFKEL